MVYDPLHISRPRECHHDRDVRVQLNSRKLAWLESLLFAVLTESQAPPVGGLGDCKPCIGKEATQ